MRGMLDKGSVYHHNSNTRRNFRNKTGNKMHKTKPTIISSNHSALFHLHPLPFESLLHLHATLIERIAQCQDVEEAPPQR